jgi:predicted dehydrogenase
MIKGRGIKLGVIGAGSMGKNHARIAASLSGINLVGIADLDLAMAQEAAAQLGVQAFADYKELLPLVEAVCIVTPTQAHFQVAEGCLSASKHLLVEKPFTGSSATARTLIAQAEKRSLIITAGLIERFNPAFQKLLKEIRGEKIIGIDIKRLSPYPERITDTDVIFDMMFHDLDLLQVLMPDEIIELKAKGEKIRSKLIDRAVATITHKSGAISRVEASRVFGSRTRNIAVTTERHVIEADLLNKSIYIRDFSSPSPSTIPIKPNDQLTEELKDFMEAIKTKSRTTVTPEAILKTLTLAEEIKKLC